MAYYHVTRRLLVALERGERRYPEVCHAQIAAFHTAYVANRSAPGPFWTPYYAQAQGRLRATADPGRCLYRLFECGTTAHIRGDLPAALRTTRPPELAWEALWPDFLADDPLFAHATHDALGDLERATRRTHGLWRTTHRPFLELGEWLLGRFGEGSAKVRRLRHAAWKEAAQA